MLCSYEERASFGRIRALSNRDVTRLPTPSYDASYRPLLALGSNLELSLRQLTSWRSTEENSTRRAPAGLRGAGGKMKL